MITSYKRTQGFTIVELLIVIVVIAILAAITIVAYNGITDRAKLSVMRSDLSNVQKRFEIARINSADGLYPAYNTLSTVFGSDKLSISKTNYALWRNNWYYCPSTDRQSYALGVSMGKQSGDSSRDYYILANQSSPVLAGGEINATTTCAFAGGSASAYAAFYAASVWASYLN